MMSSPPLVSVLLITYNQEAYIGQALESVLNQSTNFLYEVVVGEDCSTDNTKGVILEYQKKYPDKLFPVFQPKNVGAIRNAWEFCYPKLHGEFVALLEGDDFWTDPLKLQKQVDFFKLNDQYSFIFHDHEILSEQVRRSGMDENSRRDRSDFEIMRSVAIHPSTVMFKRTMKVTSGFLQSKSGDTFLYALLVMQNRKGAGYMSSVGPSVYRIHNEGVWTSQKTLRKKVQNLETFLLIRQEAPSSYYDIVDYKITMMLSSLVKYALTNLSISGLLVSFKYFAIVLTKATLRFTKPQNY